MIMKHIPEKIAAVIVSGALLAGGVAVVSTVHASEQSSSKAKSISLVVDDRPLPTDLKLNSSVAPIVKKVAPSVVKIEIKIGPRSPPSATRFRTIHSSASFLADVERYFPRRNMGSAQV